MVVIVDKFGVQLVIKFGGFKISHYICIINKQKKRKIMLYTLLEFGTLWFWIFIVVMGSFIIGYTESDEENYPASIVFVVMLAGLYFLGNSQFFNSFFKSFVTNPGLPIGLCVGYFIVGTVYSFVKWYFYLLNIKDSYEGRSYSFKIENYTASKNKERIIHWMLYWPLSGLWTLINDPIVRTFKYIFGRLSNYYDKMTNNILSDLKPKN